jgi:hypothetical protein
MKKKRVKAQDPRLQTPPGHFLKNAPWRKDFVEEPASQMITARDSVVLAFLVVSSVVVAVALWMNPPSMMSIKRDQAIKGQAVLAGNRVPRPYNGLGYDPSKFEELKDNDPIIQDDLEDVLQEKPQEDTSPKHTL